MNSVSYLVFLLGLLVGSLIAVDMSFMEAQCKAKCTRYYFIVKKDSVPQLPNDPETKGILSTEAHLECFKDAKQDCKEQCFVGCNVQLQGNFVFDKKKCGVSCTNPHCLLGCYLMSQTLRGGTNLCPSQSPLNSRSLCRNTCQWDHQCSQPLDKCCSVGCDTSTCVKSAFNDSIPPVPDNLSLTEENNGLSIGWQEPFESYIKNHGMVVFIVQVRIGGCSVYTNGMWSEWRRLVLANNLGVFLDKFMKGDYYQFRVASVSHLGTRGFGKPSKTYHPPNLDSKPPSRPRNLTDIRWRIYADGRISVVITWQKPKYFDLAIDKYMVRWVIDHGYVQPDGQSLESLTSYTQEIAGDKHMFTLNDLRPSTSYKVQVRAVSTYCRGKKLISNPNTLFISTMSIESKSKTNTQTSPDSSCICKNAKFITPVIEATPPVYSRNNLTYTLKLHSKDVAYMVEWSPRVCIEANNAKTVQKQKLEDTLRITGLDFNCRYSLKLTPIESSNLGFHPLKQPSVIKSCFCTPSCSDVEVEFGSSPPICAYERISLPSPPEQITAKIVDPLNLEYRISWSPVVQSKDNKRNTRRSRQPSYSSYPNYNSYSPYNQVIRRYRVVWAPREEEPVNKEMYNDEAGFSPIIDFRNSDVRVVSENVTWLNLKNLKGATFYIVRVQTLLSINGEDIESSPAVLYFTTIGFQNPSQTDKNILSKFINNSSSSISFSRWWSTVLLLISLFVI